MSELTSLPVSQSAAEPATREHGTIPLSLGMQVANAIAVIVPFLGLVLGIVFLWGHGFSWVELGLFLGMYIVTGVGITVGYHRLFTHRAFETSRVVQFILAVLGSMAVQGPLMQWVAMHRRHHQHSDQEGDPHSPHLHGGGFFDLVRGAWHAHVGWVFRPDPADLAHYNRDLRQSRTLRAASALFPLWVALGLIIPAVVGGVLTASWMGALFGLIWGGLARIFLVHHITWSVNSVCHIWGRRPYPSGDHSRNNFVFGILALGEGWHNNHHAFPTSARHGLRWWQFDLSYYVIRGMALVGLVWKVKVPTKQALTAECS
ncbi:MAG TPA: acyl-CoA desaturase [Gemmataceae bacterium]|nr:acyl-CoA desaturase [Gemmataceae bacterium]